MRFIPVFEPSIGSKEIEYVTDAVKSGWVSSLGPYIQRLEESFAKYCGVQYALTTSNGTTALHLILAASNIGAGDEVIIPDLSFIATANAVAYTGATPVFADVERDTLCLDPVSFEAAITPRTKAVMPVHLYGHPADMDAINRISKARGLLVIEDSAEAVGASIGAKRVGSLGHAAAFSLYGNKIITSGEGGLVTTDDVELYNEMKHLRDQAMDPNRRYWHDRIGFNYRMTNMQAALGLAQLERIDGILESKEALFKKYHDRLSQLSPKARMNTKRQGVRPVYWAMCLEFDGMLEEQRAHFMNYLRERNIDTRPYFFPMSTMPMYAHSRAIAPVALTASSNGINLPSSISLSDDEVDYICNAIESYVAEGFSVHG